jgi:hypothetical protein
MGKLCFDEIGGDRTLYPSRNGRTVD